MVDRPPSRDPPASARLRDRLNYSDAKLLAECELHTYRASGPGGQKRNKTSSAVRLHHGPTGLIVTAVESRSQHENKAQALRRLREAIALHVRTPLPVQVPWPDGVSVPDGHLQVGAQNPARYHVLALALDALADERGSLAAAAARLGVTTSSLKHFLSRHPKAWAQANQIRASAGLRPLMD